MPKPKTQRSKTALTFANIESIDSPASNNDLPEEILGATSGPDSPVSEQESSPSLQNPTKSEKKSRAKKKDFNLNPEDEDKMLDFIRDNPVLWNLKMTDYRRKDKKAKLWVDQAELMGKSVENLKGWFRSLRDTHTRLHKTKSGSGVPQFTEREEWIIKKFAFLLGVTRHRPEPMKSVSNLLVAYYLLLTHLANFK